MSHLLIKASKMAVLGATVLLTMTSSNALSAQIKISDPAKLLPPIAKWQGKSVALISNNTMWQTPAELSHFTTTPSYEETIQFLEKLAARSELIQVSYFGKSALGRPLPLVHVSSDFNVPSRLKLLAQAGIHAGEIDGKDAGLMLLRDIALGKKSALVDNVDLLFVPIFNADGHENKSQYNRVNQRGPSNMGWRSTAQNINLNRDYAKVQSIEMQSMLKLINHYDPSLYLDLHVTDGVDYQYDITYGTNGEHSYSPAIAGWFAQYYRPTLDNDLNIMGHVPGNLIFAKDNRDIKKGINGWSATPRYSDGYGAARHLPTVLVENHSLKPYRQRVLGTYVLIESSLKLLDENGVQLTNAIKQDKETRPRTLPLGWDYNKPHNVSFKGIEYLTFDDDISGALQVKWTGNNKQYDMPWFNQDVPTKITKLPKSYWIMPQHVQAIDVLKQHGVQMKVLTQPTTLTLEQLTVTNESFGQRPYEGEMRAKGDFEGQIKTITLPKGAVKINMDQPLGKLAFVLLEPAASDSLFQWGFFNTIFQRTEYIEGYAVVPLAKEMLKNSPVLAARFNKKLTSDKAFANNPNARLQWFYRQSPFYDKNHGIYPVLRQW
jgi:murein tripeptide amidase MpaA